MKVIKKLLLYNILLSNNAFILERLTATWEERQLEVNEILNLVLLRLNVLVLKGETLTNKI